MNAASSSGDLTFLLGISDICIEVRIRRPLWRITLMQILMGEMLQMPKDSLASGNDLKQGTKTLMPMPFTQVILASTVHSFVPFIVLHQADGI